MQEKVAGSKVVEGEILSGSSARIIRDGSIIYTGKIMSIFKEKKSGKTGECWSRMRNNT